MVTARASQLSLLRGLDGVLGGSCAPEALEEALAAEGIAPVVALDEAGRGPLAGPVVAGATLFAGACRVAGVGDSKRLSREARRALVPRIRDAAQATAIGLATAEEIDALNILEATRLAAERAIAALGVEPAVVLTDALTLPRLACPVVPIVRGDARVRAIGAASILAKEHRDALMRRLGRQWPQFGFAVHFGYPTPRHRAHLAEHGPTTVHRLTFHGAERRPGQPLIPSLFFQRTQARLDRQSEAGPAAASSGERNRLHAQITRRRGLLPEREVQELLLRCGCA
jgi:ribonuclease HII